MDNGQRLYERTRGDLGTINRSASEALDRALLTLSSAFLGGSLALIGQVVNVPNASNKWLLYCAWLAFAATIIVTVWSYVYSLLQHERLVDAAERYYMKGEQEAWTVSEQVNREVLRFVIAGGVSFVGGIVLLVAFVLFSPGKG